VATIPWWHPAGHLHGWWDSWISAEQWRGTCSWTPRCNRRC